MVEDGAMKDETIFLFHLRIQDGVPQFLHPLEGTLEWIERLKKSSLEGRYGAEPRIESINLFKEELQGILKKAIQRWVADRWFPERFVLAAVSFLLAYFFFSYVIRDPVPVIDEIVLSFLAGILTFRGLAKRYYAREEVTTLTRSLQEKLDHIHFKESSLIRNLETLLEEWEEVPFDALLDRWRRGEKLALNPEDVEEAQGLLLALECRFTEKKRKRFLKELEKGSIGKKQKGQARDRVYLFLYHFLLRSLS
ncbi:MAG: hypothetical protein N2442_05535 [Spirochaetes bacterium]|nr:hypothetical protein [Spirochaetota bacterium]